ncbi:MAG: hypothetical protein LBJ17_07460 [Dysgonamonadaceae bacterium]|jgi:hypothetical protein|nr:hypothetical protein [Dysgonamonadaceae bacterium]
MRIFCKLYFSLVVIFALLSCFGGTPDYLQESFIIAGSNRAELQKVLDQYLKTPADSLKYRATVFLISNMAGHYSYAGSVL